MSPFLVGLGTFLAGVGAVVTAVYAAEQVRIATNQVVIAEDQSLQQATYDITAPVRHVAVWQPDPSKAVYSIRNGSTTPTKVLIVYGVSEDVGLREADELIVGPCEQWLVTFTGEPQDEDGFPVFVLYGNSIRSDENRFVVQKPEWVTNAVVDWHWMPFMVQQVIFSNTSMNRPRSKKVGPVSDCAPE
jgi:hypothetical protein